jgi:FAD/FMN-containing dehydrogenase
MKRIRIFVMAIYVLFLFGSIHLFQIQQSNPVFEDRGRLVSVKMKTVTSGEAEEDLKKIVLDAKQNKDKISIAGMQHSQGGQTLYPGGILLNMKKYNKIVELDEQNKLITVQSGITWNDIQHFINPKGLALKVSQSQNIFTVGGSLSVNVHGRDIRHQGLIETVHSFRLLTAEGKIITVSRNENVELFKSVIGGYGLFGIILDVTLHLTDNELYKIESKSLTIDEYSDYFEQHVIQNNQVKMHLARLSVAPSTFLNDMYVTNYMESKDQSLLEENLTLKRDSLIAVPKLFLGLSRQSEWGKNIFWETQEKYNNRIDGSYITRNNVMRSDSTFMDYDHARKTEILQEYFVPVDNYADYINDLRALLLTHPDFNLLNITVRYVEKNEEAMMSYAKDDMFALVLLINQGMDVESMKMNTNVIQKMIDVTLEHEGSYYLPYYSFATKAQLEKAYPRTDEFFTLKDKYDPEHLFLNLFFEEYYE